MILGGTHNMGIGVAVSLRDQFTARANSVSSAMGRMHDNVRTIMADNLRATRNLSLGVAASGVMMFRGLNRAIKAGSEFNYIMAAVKAVTEEGTVSINQMHDLALDVSRRTIHTAIEIADAMKYLGMAGLSRKNIQESINAVSYLGAATDTHIGGMEGAADILSNIMQQFNLGAQTSMRVADILTAATTRANTNLTSLGQAVYYAGGQLSALNISLEESVGLLATVAGAGYRGSFAGTAIMNMLQQLAKALGEFRTAKQAKVLEQWGLTPKDVFQMKNGVAHLLPVADLIENIGKKVESGITGSAQIDALFGKRGTRGFIAALRDPKIGMNLREMIQFLQTESSGKAFDVAKQRLENMHGYTMIMKSAWEAFLVAIEEALEPILIPALKAITSIINVLVDITKHPIGKWFVVAAIAAGALITVGAGLLAVFTSIALLAVTSTTSFKAMGMALSWAWNSAAAAAARYIAVSRGATWVGAGGTFTMKGVKGFQKAAPATGGIGSLISTALFGGMGSVGGLFSKLVPALIKFLRVLTGPIGVIIWLTDALIGFKNVFAGVYYLFGTIFQGLFYVADFLKTFFSTFSVSQALDTANKNFSKRQEVLKKNAGFEVKENSNVPYSETVVKAEPSYQARMKEDLAKFYAEISNKNSPRMDSLNKGKPTLINNAIFIDGKKVAESMQEYNDRKLDELLNP